MMRADEVFASDTGAVHGVHCVTRRDVSFFLVQNYESAFKGAEKTGLRSVSVVTKGTSTRRVTS